MRVRFGRVIQRDGEHFIEPRLKNGKLKRTRRKSNATHIVYVGGPWDGRQWRREIKGSEHKTSCMKMVESAKDRNWLIAAGVLEVWEEQAAKDATRVQTKPPWRVLGMAGRYVASMDGTMRWCQPHRVA